MATAQLDLADSVSRYARTYHDLIGECHHVASPLGAWLLLALCAPAATGDELSWVLGCDAAQAADLAGGLLADPHPLVAAAAAVWYRPGKADPRWLAGLPASVEQGPVPGQAGLDDWVRRHTFGLVDRFPVRADRLSYLLLASALATKVSWDCPFELAPGSALGGSSPWAQRLTHVLRAPGHPGHRAFVAVTPQAGDVAVHIGRARGGLLVASVAAAPEVAQGDVLAAAHGVAIAQALGHPVPARSLFDLPLGDGPLWSVAEEMSADGGGERCVAYLPAWSAQSEHDLTDPRLGFAAAAAALGHGDPWQARQAVTARYTRVGFEAAAVTAMATMLSMRRSRRALLRTAELRFGHPYAVVAVTADEDSGPRRPVATPSPWHGIPVFSAWVAEPREAG
ncbi:MAG TPA: hypothetical protein VNF47_02875 [Streptosporangiaceae bacterium]|nr:hypothetical protein [Streptosporangiaceae bacterium]